ncbi:hypothetical protein [Pseudomonas chlororaphis]|uniref:hypothetical protein n=1 Tax=Pseudomonas chlororaphis TaxID=587753 RepID=UPI0039E6E276
MKIEQKNTQSMPALLCNACGVDAQETKSLCCEAADIISHLSSATELLIPHDRLRQAAPTEVTLIASERPHAQPVRGYTHSAATIRGCLVEAIDATLPATGTLPTVYKMSGHEHLAVSPNARRVHERYSL